MNADGIKMVKPIAPEDIRLGRYAAILYETREYLPYGVLFGEMPGAIPATLKPVRATWLPCECDECKPGQPLKVISVCLPYVLIEDAAGKRRSLDTRRVKLARVSKDYAREYIAGVKAAKSKRKTKKK